MNKFSKLGITKAMLDVIAREGFEEPTEIQEKTIPLILKGRDVIAGAATGSGKTFAFSTGIIKNSESFQGVQALVITPTRELALQVAMVLKTFAKHKKLSVATVYGGVSINPQIRNIKRAEIVVGTPGRLLDHLERKTLTLKNVKTLVLDEADRMLDMGFLPDVTKIIRNCPKNRQTLLFSATISSDIHKLAKRYMRNEVKVLAKSFVDPTKLRQVYYDTPKNLKFSMLVHLAKTEPHRGLSMVFCNTRRNVDFVVKNLKAAGVNAMAIHGGFSQAKREKTIKTFYNKNISVLVCTDVAARGLDIQGVTHVYNYDAPRESKQYIHRIGRTARAGEQGLAINLVSDRDYENFARVLDETQLKIKKLSMPKIERVVARVGTTRGKRPFGKRGIGSKDRRPARSQGRKPSRGQGSRGRSTRSAGSSRGGTSRGLSRAERRSKKW